ncbi:MAG: hypothetical protein ACRDAX_09960 [Propionibacteriaceae bacterium]
MTKFLLIFLGGQLLRLGELAAVVLLSPWFMQALIRISVSKKKVELFLGWLIIMLLAAGIVATVATVKKVAFSVSSSGAVATIALTVIIGSLGLYSLMKHNSTKILDPITGVDRYAGNKHLMVSLIFIFVAIAGVLMDLIPYFLNIERN